MTSSPRPPGVSDYALLVILALIWGGSFPLIKIAVDTIPAVSLTALRLTIAAIVLAVVAIATGQRLLFIGVSAR